MSGVTSQGIVQREEEGRASGPADETPRMLRGRGADAGRAAGALLPCGAGPRTRPSSQGLSARGTRGMAATPLTTRARLTEQGGPGKTAAVRNPNSLAKKQPHPSPSCQTALLHLK